MKIQKKKFMMPPTDPSNSGIKQNSAVHQAEPMSAGVSGNRANT